MRAPGLIGTLQLAVAAVFAIPLALFGLQWLAEGQLLGLAFLTLAGLMLLLSQLFTNPLDPGDVVESATDRVTRDDE